MKPRRNNRSAERRRVLEGELTTWVALSRRHYHPDRIILFGSLARGQVRNWSDADHVVVKQTPMPFLDRVDEVPRLLRPRAGVDVFVYTPEEFDRMSRGRRSRNKAQASLRTPKRFAMYRALGMRASAWSAAARCRFVSESSKTSKFQL
jgi:predicted nucleotidyltransferase